MEQAGRITPKVVVEDDEMIPVMMMIYILVVPQSVGVMVTEAMVVEEEVEEEGEVILSIVGAKNVGSHVMDHMGTIGDDRIKLMINLWFC